MVESMRVRITGSTADCWYCDRIGEVFVVQKESNGHDNTINPIHRLISQDPLLRGGGIYSNDFEIVHDKEEFPTLVSSYDFTSV